MEVSIKKVVFEGIDSLEISDGRVAAVVTTACGPRILFYGFKGGFNHMALVDKSYDNGFRMLGGHRLWHAPEHIERTYQPDNDKVKVTLTENGAIFAAKPEKKTGLQKFLALEFFDDNRLAVTTRLVNTNMFKVEASLWSITMLAKGSIIAVPNSDIDTGLLANRAIALWPYSNMNDERVYWGADYITIKHSDDPKPFKLGTTCDSEYCAIFNGGELMLKRFPFIVGEKYPSHGCNFEAYTCAEFSEAEALSPLVDIEPNGGDVEMEEVWELYGDVPAPDYKDEDAIAEVLGRFIDDDDDCGDCGGDCGGDCDGDCDCEGDCDGDCDCGCHG